MADPAAFTSRDHPETRAKQLNSLNGRVKALETRLTAQGAIANDASGAANEATVNAILAALRTAGIISA